MGASEQPNITLAPLMSNLQKQGLDSYLRAALSMMQGTPLGQAWGGATTASYNPKVFDLKAKMPTYSNAFKFGQREEGSGGGGGTGGGSTGGGGTGSGGTGGGPGKREPGEKGGGGRGGGGGGKRGGMMSTMAGANPATGPGGGGTSGWVSPWQSILRNLRMPTENAAATGLGAQPTQLSNMMASQFARPATYALTGNYPKY